MRSQYFAYHVGIQNLFISITLPILVANTFSITERDDGRQIGENWTIQLACVTWFVRAKLSSDICLLQFSGQFHPLDRARARFSQFSILFLEWRLARWHLCSNCKFFLCSYWRLPDIHSFFSLVQHCEIIYIYSLAASSERLQNLLRLFDPSKGLKIHSIMNKDRAAILDVVESKNLQISCNLESLLHHLPSADALKFDVT